MTDNNGLVKVEQVDDARAGAYVEECLQAGRRDYDRLVQAFARARVETIASLSTLPQQGDLVTELVDETQFLIDRFSELDWCDFDEFAREWNGHVDPPLARIRSLLSKVRRKGDHD